MAKHAPAAATRVRLRYLTDQLAIDVVNAPPPGGVRSNGSYSGASHSSGSHSAALPVAALHGPRLNGSWSGGRGLQGMRERAELYGGQLKAGATPDGGFAVAAAIPYDGSPPAESYPGAPPGAAVAPGSVAPGPVAPPAGAAPTAGSRTVANEASATEARAARAGPCAAADGGTA